MFEPFQPNKDKVQLIIENFYKIKELKNEYFKSEQYDGSDKSTDTSSMQNIVCSQIDLNKFTINQYCSMENVKNNDRRKPVTKTEQYPYSAIGLLTFQNEEGQSIYGTAFLFGLNKAITAAHNIFDLKTTNKQYKNFKFYPGIDGQNGKQYKVKRFHYKKEQFQKCQHVSKQRQLIDFALLQFEENIGEEYGYFGLDFSTNRTSGEFKICGYPGFYYINKKTQKLNGKMLQHSGKLLKIKNQKRIIQYNIDTSGGQSGSPIFKQENGRYVAIGLHTDGFPDRNQGLLFNLYIRKQLNLWIPEYVAQLQIFSAKLNDQELRLILEDQKIRTQCIDVLTIHGNYITNKGIQYLCQHSWPKLKYLDLCENRLEDEAAKQLLTRPWNNLIHLALLENQLSDKKKCELQSKVYKNKRNKRINVIVQ